MANFKKVLAGVLAAAMVLTAAPIASIPAQAANKTVKVNVGKTKKVTFKKNATKKTIKFAKAAQKKIVKVTYSKKTGKVAFKGLKKGTAKVTVKLVVGKKTYKNVYTVKVTKAAATKVAVTGVKLSNSTPKVGDTISATVEPAGATGLTYAWYTSDKADGTFALIEGATTASYTVAAADVNKFIKVQVNGDNDSSASAVTTAAVAEDKGAELAITAEQIGASKIKVTANKQVATTDKVTVKRGTSTVDATFTVDETGTILTVTTGAKLADAEYDITVTPADTKQAAASTKLAAKAAKLTKIDFAGENLVLKNTAFTQASVKIFGYNDFDEKISLPSLTPYTTKGTSVKYEASSNEIVVTTGATAPFQSGEQVTITAIYQDGTAVQQVSKALTVSAQASLAKIEFGELATTNTALKGKPITINNMKTGTYYKTVKAEDQYGNTLSAKDLNDMIYSSTNTSGTLFVTPNQAAGSYVYLDSFDTDTKDNVIARFKLGALAMAGSQTFTYTGVGGFSATDTIDIVDNPFIAELTVSVPEMYGGKEAEITITAKDQDGNALDLYDYVAKTQDLNTTTAAQEFSFTDKNSVTKACSKITIPKDMAFKVVKNTTTKTVKFTVTPASNTTANNVTYILVVQSAKPSVSNVNCVVQSDPVSYSISNKLKDSGSNAATLKSGKTFDFEAQTLLLDQYGASFGYVSAKKGGALAVNTGAAITDATTGIATKWAVQFKDASGAIVATPTAVGTAGKYTAELWYDEDGATTTIKAKLLDTKTFTINVADTKYSNYTASLKSADKLLYIGGQADTETIVVKAQDSTGTEVTLDAGADYTVQLADVPKAAGACVTAGGTGNATLTSGTTAGTNAIAYSATTGEVKGELTANVFVGADQVASVKVPYSNAPQKTASYVAKKGTATVNSDYDLSQGITIDSITAGNYEFSGGHAGADFLAIDPDSTTVGAAAMVLAADTIVIKAVDQYGLSNFDVTFGSTNIASNAGNTALWADAGTVTLSGTLTSYVKIETKDSSYKKVITHVNGTMDIGPTPDEATVTTNTTAFTGVDQYGKDMALAGLTVRNAVAMDKVSGTGTATVAITITATGLVNITVTKAGASDVISAVGDKYTYTSDGITYTAEVKAISQGGKTTTATDNEGITFTVTAKYN